MLDSSIKVLLFIKIVSQILFFISFLMSGLFFLPLDPFVIRDSFFGLFGKSLLFFLAFFLFLLFLKLFHPGVVFFLGLLHDFEIETGDDLEDLHESFVDLHELHEHLRVGLAELELHFEVWVVHVPPRLLVHHQLGQCFRVEERIVACGHLALQGAERLLDLRVCRFELQAFFVGFLGLLVFVKGSESHAFPLVAFGPARVDRNAFVRAFHSFFKLVHIEVARREVAVQRVVRRV
mmetsp:Transcript_33386/g.38334  ORF Transcript_33386/g.38334 Transcript_33386/m.38334 type:complete len:235 (-) Transcript_33386:104-808(-)